MKSASNYTHGLVELAVPLIRNLGQHGYPNTMPNMTTVQWPEIHAGSVGLSAMRGPIVILVLVYLHESGRGNGEVPSYYR